MKTIIIILALAIGIIPGLYAASYDSKVIPGKPSIGFGISMDLLHPDDQSQDVKKTPVKPAELMKSIQDDLAAQFKGWTVSEAYKVDKKGVITYKVTIKKDSAEKTLVYDSNGKYVSEYVPEKMKTETKQTEEPPKK